MLPGRSSLRLGRRGKLTRLALGPPERRQLFWSGFTIFVVVLLSGVPGRLLGTIVVSKSLAKAILHGSLVACYLVGLATVIEALNKGWRPGVKLFPVLAFTLWATASGAWSVMAGESLTSAAALVGTVLVGIALGLRISAYSALRTILMLGAVALVASIGTALWVPQVGISREFGGAWRGVFENRNVLARWACLELLVSLVLVAGRHRRSDVVWGSIAGSLSLLVAWMSKSTTGLVVSGALTIGTLLLLAIFRSHGILRWLFAMFAGSIIVAGTAGLWSYRTQALIASGRDTSLSGRTYIWKKSLLLIDRHSATGLGYGAAWEPKSPLTGVQIGPGRTAPNAHNGFLDIYLELGPLGVLLLVLCLASLATWNRRVSTRPRYLRLWSLLYLTFLVLYDISESTLFVENTVFAVLLVASIMWRTQWRRNRGSEHARLYVPCS